VGQRKYVLDTNCFIDAARDPEFRAAFSRFSEATAPRLYLSLVVATELRASPLDPPSRRRLEDEVLGPYYRRGRLLTPSRRSWEGLGEVLGTLWQKEGLLPEQTPRSFVFDVLMALSCRDVGAVLISRNTKDLARIARVIPIEYETPFPDPE
jgi:predicted nucleic acid-binding protein